MLNFKPGVTLKGLKPEALLGIVVAERLFHKYGHLMTITSCLDGEHMKGSLHYVGQAFDLRSKLISPMILDRLVPEIQEALGENYDVVREPDHIHIEFDPPVPTGVKVA